VKKVCMVIISVVILSCLSACSCSHEWVNASCTQSVCCSICGETAGDPLGHVWRDATCTTAKTCFVCGVAEGKPTEHVWADATCITPKTCSVCHVTEGIATHKWQAATCTSPKTCSICLVTEGDTVHSWQAATCTLPTTCSSCGATMSNALGHTSDENCLRCGFIDSSLAIEKAKNLIRIYGIDLDMDSAGGIDTCITWKNVSSKEFQYVYFHVQYYNRVKDVLSDEIDGTTTTILSATGPFPYGKGNYEAYSYSRSSDSAETLYFTVPSGYKNDTENGWADRYWEAPFYNTTTEYVKLVRIDIEYMDGTTYTISEPDAIASIVGSGHHPNAWSTDDFGDDYLR